MDTLDIHEAISLGIAARAAALSSVQCDGDAAIRGAVFSLLFTTTATEYVGALAGEHVARVGDPKLIIGTGADHALEESSMRAERERTARPIEVLSAVRRSRIFMTAPRPQDATS